MALSTRKSLRVRLACAVTLTLAALVSVSWARSYRYDDRLSSRVFGARYTVRAQGGWLRLLGPPPEPPGLEQDVRRFESLTNDDVRWNLEIGGRPDPRPLLAVVAEDQLPFSSFVSPRTLPYRTLLAALEDPRRFVCAHVGLRHRAWGPYGYIRCDWQGKDLVLVDNGLRITLRPNFASPALHKRHREEGPIAWSNDTYRYYTQRPATASVDVAQLSAIRRMWHDRLDVQHAAVPHAAVVGALLIPPAAWAARAGRRRARRARGRCAGCGYDLRGSADRCPECGDPISATSTPIAPTSI